MPETNGDVPAEFEAGQDAPTQKTYPFDDGDFIVLGPEIFTGQPGSPGDGVISWKGENFYRTHDGKPPVAKISEPHPALKNYKIGEKVEVLRGGDFVPGVITSIQAGSVNVDTERGPVPVGGPLRIRKVG